MAETPPPSRPNKPPSKGPKPAKPGASDLMSRLIDEAVEATKHGCPNCQARVKAGQTICLSCGFNLESGKQVRTVVKKPVQDKSQGGPPNTDRNRQMMLIGVLVVLAGAGAAAYFYFGWGS